jgi:hypothetical protein
MSSVIIPGVDYTIQSIKDLKVNSQKNKNGKMEVTSIEVEGKYCEPSQRFWDSICSRFGFGPSIFRYFTHAEVFERINNTVPNDRIRLTVQLTPSEAENADTFKPILLGTSSPDKNILDHTTLIDVMNKIDTRTIEFRGGVIVSRHPPRTDTSFDIGGEEHQTRLTLEAPIDGYGKPSVYLSLLRMVCKNGLIAYSKAFHSGINIGDVQIGATLLRILESYSNEDGFVALRNRIESSQKSWTSVNEIVRLAQLIWRLEISDFKPSVIIGSYEMSIDKVEKNEVRNDVLADLYDLSGDIKEIYGVAQLDSISKKRMRTLPTKATVYKTMNLATEIATHWLRPNAARKFHGYVGELVSQEFDLEGSCEEFPTFNDFINASTADVVKEEGNTKVEEN